MSDGLPLGGLVDLLISDGSAAFNINDVNFNVRFQAGYGTSSEGQIEDATNVIITIEEFGRSFHGSQLLSEWEGSTIQVNITNSPYSAGSGATTMFGVGIVNINTSEINFKYKTVDGGYVNFNIQGILNHELVHVLTNLPDGLTHNEIVNIINSETGGGASRSNDYYDIIRPIDQCFLAGTQISMWDGTKKPIERVEAGDIVTSYDKDGTLKPGRVRRTMTNRSRQILDVHGLMVTPGHATLCGDGRFNGQHVPIIDILRSDGALVLEDGSKIRAATGCPLGSIGDRMITAIVGADQPGGRVKIAELAQIRLGTRFILPSGEDVSVLDLIAEGGGMVSGSGMITTRPGGLEMPFRWTFTSSLPKPEDYVLQRSATHLHDIYQANEWEAVRPSMPVPMGGEAGVTVSRHPALVAAAPANVPLALRGHPDAPQMSRKYRRVAEAKARKKGSLVH